MFFFSQNILVFNYKYIINIFQIIYFIVTLPETCLGKSFCFEKGDNYPDEKVEALLADMRISVRQNISS